MLRVLVTAAVLGTSHAFVSNVPAAFKCGSSISLNAVSRQRRGLDLSMTAADGNLDEFRVHSYDANRVSVCSVKAGRDPVYGLKLNEKGGIWVPQRARPRRNRKNEAIRSMTRENEVKPSNFIYPLFVHTKDYNEEISSMPGCLRHTTDSVMREVGEALAEGVSNVILFPKIPDDVKTNSADECYNPKGLVPDLISRIKSQYGSSVNIWTDVALDPYSDQGHDGMVSSDTRGDGGKARILNDETVEQLCRQAVAQARAGADVVAPSDMMDGRIGAIRDALDSEGFTDVSIVAYTAKYASAFYGEAPPAPRVRHSRALYGGRRFCGEFAVTPRRICDSTAGL
jgi:hypothetical protein